MPPTADQIAQMKHLMQAYRVHLRSAVTKHRDTAKQLLAESDLRRKQRIRQALKQP
ncbi:hypothetical protein HY479_00100 [Candidatus Uhrbacteria bacterium]|nr:hypothetical protein [Candidatus Uhrbacteria bacterium]